MKVLILGGTGVISREIVQQLLERHDEVMIYHRGQRNIEFSREVEYIKGDRHDEQALASMVQHRSFDAVIDMICFNEEDARSSVNIFKQCSNQLIVCSSVAAYQRPFRSIPTREEAEVLIDHPAFLYGYHKAEMERYLQTVTAQNDIHVTIIRPSLTYGIGSANVGVLRQNYGIVDRIRKGKPLVMFGDGTTPWNFTFASDLAKAFIGAIANARTFGQAYHATNGDLHYWQDLYLEFGRILGIEPNIVHVPTALLSIAAPQLCAHLEDEKKYPSIYDNRKVSRDIPSFRPHISLRNGLEMLLSWYEETGQQVDQEKDALEDQLVNLQHQWAHQVAGLYTKG